MIEKKHIIKKHKYLTKEELTSTKKYSVVEGSFTSSTTGFGEQYIIPFALRVGATTSEISFLSSFPVLLGSIFQILGAKLANSIGDRKKIVIAFVIIQALTLIPLFIVPLLTKSISLLTLIFCLYMIAGNVASPSWNSWLGDVVPENERVTYFAKRNKVSTSALLLSVIAAGIILSLTSNNIWVGFGILFSIALIGRATAAYLFTKHTEPLYVADTQQNVSLKGFLTHLNKTNFGNFVLFRFFISFSVMVSAPFFAVYMLNNLNFSYIEFSLVVLFPMLIKVLTFDLWTKYIKKYGTKSMITVSGLLIAAIPLLWFFWSIIFSNKLTLFIAILLTEAMSGLAWGGFELTTFNYMLDNTSSGHRAKLFSYYTFLFGIAVFLGGITGGFLIKIFEKYVHYLTPLLIVFLTSSFLRLLSVIILSPKLKDTKIHSKVSERRIFYEMFIQRPIGFAVTTTMHRLLILEKKIEHMSKPIPAMLKKDILKRSIIDKIFKNKKK